MFTNLGFWKKLTIYAIRYSEFIETVSVLSLYAIYSYFRYNVCERITLICEVGKDPAKLESAQAIWVIGRFSPKASMFIKLVVLRGRKLSDHVCTRINDY